MNQYYQILSSCRIPGPKRDSIVNYAKGKKQSRHITVVHNFQVWQLLSFQGLFRCRCPFQLAVVRGKGTTESLCLQGLPHQGFIPAPLIAFGFSWPIAGIAVCEATDYGAEKCSHPVSCPCSSSQSPEIMSGTGNCKWKLHNKPHYHS